MVALVDPNQFRFGMAAGTNPSVFTTTNPTTSQGTVFAPPVQSVPGAPAPGGWTGLGGFDASQIGGPATKLGMNLGTANLALSGLSTIGNFWASMKQLGLAKKQFAFQRDFANANLANSLKSYNTALADRARARGFTEGQSQSQIDGYVQKNQLTDTRRKI